MVAIFTKPSKHNTFPLKMNMIQIWVQIRGSKTKL